MSWVSRLVCSLRGEKLDRDLSDELAFHVEMKTRDLIEAGLSLEEARRQARRHFGNLALTKERTRDVHILRSLDALARDLRFSIRTLGRSRTFTGVAVLTLALGLGANIAVFSLVHGLLVRPLPFPDPQNLLLLSAVDSKGREDFISYTDLQDWRRQSKSLEHFSAYVTQSVNRTGEREPERLNGAFVSAEFFELLGARAALGRTFQAGDDQPGAPPVVVASYELWQSQFGGAADFLGKKLILNGNPFTVAGVLSAEFRFPWSDTEIWIPYPYYPNYRPGQRGGANAAGFARVRPGYSREQAQAEMTTIAGRLAAQFPDTNRDRGVRVCPFQEFLVRDLRSSVLLLWGAILFVLLIACANVANLALSRILSRDREIGIRAALGAGRSQLLRQLLVENLLIAFAGGCLGLLLAHWGTQLLAASQAETLPVGTRVELNAVSAAFGFSLALVGGLFCGLLPAVHVLRRDGAGLQDRGRNASESRQRGFTRRLLVVAEIALCLVLLAGAGLLLRSFARLSGVDPGFRTANLLTLEYRVPRNKYPRPQQQWNFHWLVVQRIRELPGVRSASAVLALPFSGNGGQTTFFLPDRPEPPPGSELRASINRAAPGFFETLRIPLLRGRFIEERDHAAAAPVAVVSQTFAQRYWPGQDPIGRQVRLPEFQNTAVTIVGVAGDIRHSHLEDPQPVQIYLPFAQHPHIFSTLVIETRSDPMSCANAVRRAVWSVDRDQPVWKVRTLESLVSRYLAWRSFLPRLVSGFSAFALLLAALGVYGVISYSTARRTREFGLRIAVGAQPRDVARLVLGDGVRMTLAGIALGSAGALFLTPLLKSQLYGVSPSDPLTLLTVAILLALVALLASYLPARRALRVDPVTALRHE